MKIHEKQKSHDTYHKNIAQYKQSSKTINWYFVFLERDIERDREWHTKHMRIYVSFSIGNKKVFIVNMILSYIYFVFFLWYQKILHTYVHTYIIFVLYREMFQKVFNNYQVGKENTKLLYVHVLCIYVFVISLTKILFC